ncbi:MAG: hypothetical protein IPN90_12950 [Elusimicrobia bacterium]|nr:hypothetical protein [Elusimicrobiota bacterium]
MNDRIRLLPKISGAYFGQPMTANSIYTIAGEGLGSYTREGVVATTAQTYRPGGIGVDPSGNIYIATSDLIQYVPKNSGTYWGQNMQANFIYTIAGDRTAAFGGDGGPASLSKVRAAGVSVDLEGNVYVADTGNNRIRFIPKLAGTYFGQLMSAHYIYTIAGNGTAAYGGDGGAATSAQLNGPICLSVDLDGNVIIADTTNHRVRFIPKVSATYFGQSMTANSIYTVAGDGTGSFGGDTGVATSAQLYSPRGVSVDVHGNILWRIPETTGSGLSQRQGGPIMVNP